MTSILDELYTNDPAYMSLTDDERHSLRENLRDPKVSVDFFSDDPGFQQLKPQEQDQFLARFHAETPPTYQDSEKYMQEAANDQTFLSSVGNSVIASFGKSAAGVMNTFGANPYITTLMTRDANERMAKVAEYIQQQSGPTRIAHSIISNIATQGPGILAAAKLKLPAIALTQLGVLSFGSASEEAREAGYGEAGAIFRGATQAAGEVWAGSITLGALMKSAPSTRRYIFDAVLASVASNVPAEISHRARDYMMDYLRDPEVKRLAPDIENMTLPELFTHMAADFGGIAAHTAATSAGTGLFYSGVTSISLGIQGIALRNFKNANGETMTLAVTTTVPEGFTKERIQNNIEGAIDEMVGKDYANDQEAQKDFMRLFQVFNYADKIAENINNPALQSAADIESMTMTGGLEGRDISEAMSMGLPETQEPMAREPMFIGPKGKGADVNTLSLAKTLKAKGTSTDEIQKQTGWFELSPGEWSFEIPTAGIVHNLTTKGGKPTVIFPPGRMSPVSVRTFTVTEALQGTDKASENRLTKIAQAYPELNDVKIYVAASKKEENKLMGGRNVQGWAYGNTIAIRLGDKNIDETLIHEIQHVIQKLEGFSRGGNPAMEGSFEKYQRLTGEVQSRLAEWRHTHGDDKTIEQSLKDMLFAEGYTNPKSNRFVSEDVYKVLRSKRQLTPFTKPQPGKPGRPPAPIIQPIGPGMKVSISPDYFDMKGKLGGYGLEGNIVSSKINDEGVPVYTVELTKLPDVTPGTDAATTLVDVPHNMLMRSMLPWRESAHFGREMSRMVNFLRGLITHEIKGKDISDMSVKEIKQTLMGMLRVSDKLKVKGQSAWGVYMSNKKGEEFIKLAADVAAVDPRFAVHVLAHEIGHFLHLTKVTSETAKNGMGQLLNFDRTMVKYIFDNPTMFSQEIRDALHENQLNFKKQEKILYDVFGNELDAVTKAWSLLQSSETDSFREKIADFLSVLLNNPVDKQGNPLVPLSTLAPKLTGVWNKMLQTNSAIQTAWGAIDTQFNADEMMRRADVSAEEIREKLMNRPDLFTDLMVTFVDTNYALWNHFNNSHIADPIILNLREQVARDGQMQLHEERNYINPIREILNQLPQADKRNLELYAFYNHIVHNRHKLQEFMSPDAKERLKSVISALRKQMREDGKSEFEIERAIKQAEKDHTITRLVELLNPGGVTMQEAVQKLGELKAEVGEDRFNQIQKVFNDFSEFRRNWLANNMRAEGYRGDVSKIEDNENYVRFMVAHWLTEKVYTGQSALAGMHEQKGTLSDIYSPIGATMINDMAIVRNVRKNHIKKQIVALLNATGNEMIIKKLPKQQQVDSSKYVPVTVREEDNSLSYYQVDKTIGAGLYRDPAVMERYEKFNRWFTLGTPWLDSGLRRAFTTHSPVFWLNNLLRDTIRSMLNVKGGWMESMKIPMFWAESLHEAWASMHGKTNTPTVNEMVQQGLLSTVNQYIGGELGVDATMADRVAFAALQDPSMVEKDLTSLGSFIDNAKNNFNKGMKFWDNIGGAMERASKMAAYKVAMEQIKAGKITYLEATNFVRRHAGTPILTTKGEAALPMSNLFYFFNPRIQGLIGDYDALTRGDWTIPFKRATWAMSGAALPLLALSGALGEEWKRYWQKIPLYHLLRGPILPLGETAEGKAVYFVYPTDSLTSFFHAATMNALTLALEEDVDASQPIANRIHQSVTSTISGVYADLPSWNPRLQMLMDFAALSYGRSGMPVTLFGRELIPQHIADEGISSPRYQQRIIEHAWNTLGGATIYRFPYPSSSMTSGLKRKPETTKEHVWRWLEQAAGVPLIQPLAKRIQISDAGLSERQGAKESAQRMERARRQNDIVHIGRSELAKFDGNTPDQAAQLLRKIQNDHPEMWEGYMNHVRENPAEARWLSNQLKRVAEESYMLERSPELLQQFRLIRQATGNERTRLTIEMAETLRKMNYR